MSKKLVSSVIGAAAVVFLVGLQSVEHWTLVEHTIEGLKNSGSIGAFLVGILTSRIFPLVLALTTIVLAIDARTKEKERESAPK